MDDTTTSDGRAGQGKIARLSPEVRAELNRRMYGGEQGPVILPWLNGLAEVQRVLGAEFDGVPISDNNLSRWRQSGYREYKKRLERLDHTRDLSDYAAKMAQAGSGTIAEGAAAIASGKILNLLEAIEELTDVEIKVDENGKPMLPDSVIAVQALTESIVALRSGDNENKKLAQKDVELGRKQEELNLARQRFQRQSLELFLKWREDQRAVEIADGPSDNSAKIEKLGELIFGDDWAVGTAATAGMKRI